MSLRDRLKSFFPIREVRASDGSSVTPGEEGDDSQPGQSTLPIPVGACAPAKMMAVYSDSTPIPSVRLLPDKTIRLRLDDAAHESKKKEEPDQGDELDLMVLDGEEGYESPAFEDAPFDYIGKDLSTLAPRYDITRASKSALLVHPSVRTYRGRPAHKGVKPVQSYHAPLASVASRDEKKEEKRRRSTFMKAQGLPQNTLPLTVSTLYPQYAATREHLMAVCEKPRDQRFMKLFLDQGRLVPNEVWRRFTLMEALTYEHDHALFIALDTALVTFFFNLHTDLITLLAAEGRRRVTANDIRLLLQEIWPSRTRSRESLSRHFDRLF